MRKSDRTWRPQLPSEPAPPYVWALALAFLACFSVGLLGLVVLR